MQVQLPEARIEVPVVVAPQPISDFCPLLLGKLGEPPLDEPARLNRNLHIGPAEVCGDTLVMSARGAVGPLNVVEDLDRDLAGGATARGGHRCPAARVSSASGHRSLL
jgi:hypothetical protein